MGFLKFVLNYLKEEGFGLLSGFMVETLMKNLTSLNIKEKYLT